MLERKGGIDDRAQLAVVQHLDETREIGGSVVAARDPHLRVHLYGKQMRPGRKVGHVNAYGDDLEDCLERARHAAAWFRGDLGNESE